MVEFINNNWKDILEIIIGLAIGFCGGYAIKTFKVKQSVKINGNRNNIYQGGNINDKGNEK